MKTTNKYLLIAGNDVDHQEKNEWLGCFSTQDIAKAVMSEIINSDPNRKLYCWYDIIDSEDVGRWKQSKQNGMIVNESRDEQ